MDYYLDADKSLKISKEDNLQQIVIDTYYLDSKHLQDILYVYCLIDKIKEFEK